MPLKLDSRSDLEETLQAHQDAIIQLEDGRRSLERDLVAKMQQARMSAYTPDGDYRGVFENEEQARSFGYFVVSRTHENDEVRGRAAQALERNVYFNQRDLGTGDEYSGGAAVPMEFAVRVKRLIESFGVFSRNAFYMPMSSGETTFLKQVGEVVVFLLEEGIKGEESDISFKRVKLTAKEWGTLSFYPVNLDEDAVVVIGELVARSIAFSFARKTDDIAFNGDGSATYFGIQGIIPKLTQINGVDDGGGVVLGSGNAWSELTLEDFQMVQGRLPEYEGDTEPKWYCSRTFYYNVMVKLMLAAGGVTAEEIEGQRRRVFLGDPVEIVQVMPKAEGNSQVCALYGDMRRCATYGDRRGLGIAQSREYRFAERQVTVLGTNRVAVSIEDLGTDEEAGPMVGLMTQAG
ncbi:MAG: phage major capsid protein [Planctomycetota bacterium]